MGLFLGSAMPLNGFENDLTVKVLRKVQVLDAVRLSEVSVGSAEPGR